MSALALIVPECPAEDDIRRVQHTAHRHSIRSLKTIAMLNDASFKETFRLTRSNFEILYNKLGNHLKQGRTKYSIPVETKLLVAVRFFAQGSYQLSVGNDVGLGVSKTSVSKILHEVLNVINDVFCPEMITFPMEREMQQTQLWALRKYRIPGVIGMVDGTHISVVAPKNDTQLWALRKYRIPGVIGMVDGTHISVVAPKNDPQFPEFVFVNRKNFHSLNTQIVCDHKYRIWNINARFPGSSHDSYIWKQSSLRPHLLDNYADRNLFLLGDSGYPLEPILMVPFRAPQQQGEILFNEYHSKCRSTVERCIGVLKGRWRCLKLERGLHYNPTTAAKIINACVALHNFCIDRDEDYLNILIEPQEVVPIDPAAQVGSLHDQGAEIRNMLIAYILQRT